MTREGRAASEGWGGWIRLVLGTLLLTALPIWFMFTAMLVHVAGSEWWAKLLPTGGPISIFGLDLVWVVAGAEVAIGMVVLTGLALGGLAGVRLVGRLWDRRSEQGLARRYDAVVGDGDVLRPDAWEGVEVAPDEDEDDPTA